jgi:hypothetical protein
VIVTAAVEGSSWNLPSAFQTPQLELGAWSTTTLTGPVVVWTV